MPIYEFECSQCQHRFDELVSASVDIKDIVCPKCGANSPRKLMSAFGLATDGKTVSSAGSSCPTCSTTSCKTCS